MLHIANGDAAVRQLKHANLPGAVLPWCDALNEGPVLGGIPLETLSGIRARFLASRGSGDYQTVMNEFTRRDRSLADYLEHDEVVLWFGNDLHDQLQLLQLLEWFSHRSLDETQLSLIAVEILPGVEPAQGLGRLSPPEINDLFRSRTEVSWSQLSLARRAWDAYCSPDPRAIEAFLTEDSAGLPHVRAGLRRHLEQFPAVGDGLCRTTRQILTAVGQGASAPHDVLEQAEQYEARRFLATPLFWSYLGSLTLGAHPLLRTIVGRNFEPPDVDEDAEDFASDPQRLTLTGHGKEVLQRRADAVALNGIDRWRGGVHLTHRQRYWRWDPSKQRLTCIDAT
jgi:hypothetical protein